MLSYYIIKQDLLYRKIDLSLILLHLSLIFIILPKNLYLISFIAITLILTIRINIDITYFCILGSLIYLFPNQKLDIISVIMILLFVILFRNEKKIPLMSILCIIVDIKAISIGFNF